MDREPGNPALGKPRRKIVAAAGIRNRDDDGRERARGHRARAAQIHREHVAQPVPCQACLLGEGASGSSMRPDGAPVGALVVRRREAENA